MGAFPTAAVDPQILTEKISVHCEQLMLFGSWIYMIKHLSLHLQLRKKLKDKYFFLSTLLSLPWTRCIGSIQHLKNKFGKDYLLEVKLKEPAQAKPLHTEILKLFPQAARQERYCSMMAYKLPMTDVHPLSQAFFNLEKVKQTFDLEEYSLSQATLEQVFLELCKEQEMGNFDDEVDTTVKGKLLSQEEP